MSWFWIVLAASSILAVLAFVSLLGKTKHCCDSLLRQRWQVWQREQRLQAQAEARARRRAKIAEPPVGPERPKPAAQSTGKPVAAAS